MSKWRAFFSGNRTALAAALVIAGYLAMALGFEAYAIFCEARRVTPAYARGNQEERYLPPSRRHWLGTDYQGRDVLLRAAAGSATAIKVGVIGSLIAAVIGTVLGLVAGFCGGRFDDGVVWLYSTFASMPTLLFILAFALLINRNFLSPGLAEAAAAIGKVLRAEPGMLAIYLAIGLTSWVTLCRVVRAEVMKLRHLPYVAAARVCGQRPAVILFRHLLPNVMHLVIIYFTLTFATAIMSEVIVSYLGVGVQTAPSWGVMISDGQDRLWRGVWWEVAAATLFMFLLVLSLNLFGDHLRDKLDPKTRRR